MNSYGSEHDIERAVVRALQEGGTERPDEELSALLIYIESAKPGKGELANLLSELRLGVSPFHVIGEFRHQSLPSRLVVPRDVMPPGSVTPAVISLIERMCRDTQPRSVADVGTGTGVLGIAALANSTAKGVLIDISKEACRAARDNVERSGLRGRGAVVMMNGLDAIHKGDFDLVIANLPFVPTREIASLLPRFRDHSPRKAIDGGKDGLELFRRLIPDIGRSVASRGHLILQIGEGQEDSIDAVLRDDWEAPSLRSGHPNLVVRTRK